MLRAICCALVALHGLQAAQLFKAVEPHMGTLVEIKLYAAGVHAAEAAFRAAFARIEQLDETLSDYRPDSELSRITRVAAGSYIPVSADLFAILQASQRLSVETDGAFDITLGKLTRLWRQARRSGQIPSDDVLRDAAHECGFRNMHLDERRRSVMFDKPGIELDAGGIAKGYAADAALKILRARGIRSALVAMSGDLAFSDAPPGESGWAIGIGSGGAGSGYAQVRRLKNAAVSTSGDAEQHLDRGAVRYSHILDPATGRGVTTRVTVTVIAPSGLIADGFATALSVAGRVRGSAVARAHPELEAIFMENGQTN